jgi:Fe-S cluster assembly protein SufD
MQKTAKEKENYFSAYKLFARTREGRDPVWLANLREKAAGHFELLDFPTTRDEAWKYTNVAPILRKAFRQVFDLQQERVTHQDLAPFTFEETRRAQLVFVDGLHSPRLSNLSDLPAGVIVGNFSDVIPAHDKLISSHLGLHADYRDQVFTALNTAHIGDGAFVGIPSGAVIEKPIHVLYLSTAEGSISSHPRTLIVGGADSFATVVESYASLGTDPHFTNAVTEVALAEDAGLDHYRLQEENLDAFHIGTSQVGQARGSRYTSIAVSLGAALSRHNLNVAVGSEHIETTIDGLYVVTGNQHHDSHTVLDHQKPNSASHQLYKGILNDRSRAVFNGKVIVREGALLTDARQLNRNLLLSSDAHIDTKPELEIFADDVKCSHGATVGQLEDEELFYLASRGIRPERARALLTYGFAEDIISKIKLKSVRDALDRIVLEKLQQTLEVI